MAVLTARALEPDAAVVAPAYAPITGGQAPANARLYADCIGQAAATGAYRRAADRGGDELILFTCTGAHAQAFCNALGPWSASMGQAFEHGGRDYRSSAKVLANVFKVDSCSPAGGADHRCVITFNAGDCLDQ